MRAGPGADVIEPGSGRSGPAPGAADRPVPRAAGWGGGGPVDGGGAGDSAFVAGSGAPARPAPAHRASAAAPPAARQW